MNRRLAACLSTLVLGVAAAAAAGCGSGGSAAPSFEPGAPAGDVREVAGVVTARRGDAARPLAVGDVVSGDDVVETAEGASVVIELRHNGARWSLGAGQSRQVASSLAWKAPRGEATASVGGDRSTAAGRLAEREAADTASTAIATEAAAAPAAAPGAAPRPAAVAEPTAADPAPPAAAPAPAPVPRDEPPAAPKPPPPAPKGGSGSDDDVVRGLGDVETVGGGSGAPGGGGTGATGTVAPPDAATPKIRLRGVTSTGGLTRVQARGHVARHIAQIAGCWAEQLASGATGSGTADLVLQVAADGAVTSLDAKLDAAVEPTRACIVAAAQAWSFPAADRGSEVHASFKLSVE